MIPLQVLHDQRSGEDVIEVPLRGQMLLEVPLLNKGSAFSEEERRELGLEGLLPPHVSTPEEQRERSYHNFRGKTSDIEKCVFLASLQDRNETLYYKLLGAHVAEMLPIVYTPTVGLACQEYSHLYRRPRGLYLAYPHRDRLVEMLRNAPHPEVRVIVVTDGERILGLGDLGVGGLGISIGKLALYSLCAGIHPASTLPVVLDVGTDNRRLLEDPLYLGWRHERIRGEAYDAFVAAFVEAAGARLRDQRIVHLGGGSAATGICDQTVASLVQDGCPEPEAIASIWMVDSRGLVLAGRSAPHSAQP